MKHLIPVLAVVALLSAGCKSPVGPLVTQTAVFVGLTAELANNPETLPAVKAGADIVCAIANGTNANPAALVAALDAAGPWTPLERAALDGIVVTAIEIAVNQNTNSSATPYFKAACNGMGLAIATAPAGSPTVRNAPPPMAMLRASRPKTVTVDPKWPRMK